MNVADLTRSAEKWQQRTMHSDKEWMEESLRAYLDGRYPHVKWIAGIVHAFGDIPVAAQILTRLRGYGSAERYAELTCWFDSGCPLSTLR